MMSRNVMRLTLLFSCLVMSCFPAAVIANDNRPIAVEDSLRARTFGSLMPIALSPEGKWLAYTVKDSERSRAVSNEEWAKTGIRGVFTGTDIYLLNTATGMSRCLTGGKGSNFLPVWSPNGRYVAFVSDRDGSGQARLWVWDAVRDNLRKVADLDVRAFYVRWMPDSQKILVTVIPKGMSLTEYVATRMSQTGGVRRTSEIQAFRKTVTVFHSGTVGTNEQNPVADPWSLNLDLWDLAVVDISSGEAKIVLHGHRIEYYLPSPDGSHIAYTTEKRFEAPGSQQLIFDLGVVNVTTGEERTLVSDIRLGFDGMFSWSPDGSQLSYVANAAGEREMSCNIVGINGGVHDVSQSALPRGSVFNVGANDLWDAEGKNIYFIDDGALWRASADGHGVREIARIAGRKITYMIPQTDSLMWASDGGGSTIVLTHDEVGKQDGFYKVDLATGKSRKLLEQGQCYSCANVQEQQLTSSSQDGKRLVYYSEDATHDTDLWMSDVDFEHTRRLTHLNPQLEHYEMGAARLIDWLSDDGERLQGALLLPSRYQEGQRYPLIVYVYGGHLLSNDFDHFGLAGRGPFNMELLATRGYAVLLPDSPSHLGTPMLDVLKTVLPGVNKVIDLGVADPQRIGVMGHSNGGYSTLALIVQTKRFAAAVDADGFGDLVGMYGEMSEDGTAFGTSLEQGYDALGGTPWQLAETYVQNSPIFYLNRVDTPLLILHGEADRTVAPFLGDELFVGLRRLGKEVEYAKYRREDHSPLYWSYADQMDFCNRIIAWFDKYLKGPQTEQNLSPSPDANRK